MSPYRVLVSTKNGSAVMSAMLSKDKVTADNMIYIVLKSAPDANSSIEVSERSIAHSQTTRRNSSILSTYMIVPSDSGRSYSVKKIYYKNDSGSVGLDIPGIEYTQSDCLRSAMNHFCTSNGYTIVQDL